MSNGFKNVVINTRERAVSLDINRLQKFMGRDLTDYFRFMFDAVTQHDLEGGGTSVLGAAVTNPLRGIILNGLTPKPEIGGVNVTIDAGIALLVDPESPLNSDDGPYKFVSSAGVSAPGTLTLTPNASGSTRIDIIECQRVQNDPATKEVDNRDIYDVATGLFNATTVDKAYRDGLTFRIRTGTPGGGFAGVGTVSGWLPMTVCRVPNGTVSWDTVDLWDVRPLASDLEFLSGAAINLLAERCDHVVRRMERFVESVEALLASERRSRRPAQRATPAAARRKPGV